MVEIGLTQRNNRTSSFVNERDAEKSERDGDKGHDRVENRPPAVSRRHFSDPERSLDDGISRHRDHEEKQDSERVEHHVRQRDLNSYLNHADKVTNLLSPFNLAKNG